MTIGLFAEGIVSLALPCTWVLVVPPILATVAGEARRSVAVAATGGLVAAVMVRAASFGVLPPELTVPAGAVMALAFGVIRLRPRWAPAAASVVAALGASIWQPCVGLHLGEVLNTGIDHPVRAAVTIVPFAAGVALAVPAAVFAVGLAGDRFRQPASIGSAIGGFLLGVAVLVGLHESVVGDLARVSAELLERL